MRSAVNELCYFVLTVGCVHEKSPRSPRPDLFVSSITFTSGGRPISDNIDVTHHLLPRRCQPCDFSAHVGQTHSYANTQARGPAAAHEDDCRNEMSKHGPLQPANRRHKDRRWKTTREKTGHGQHHTRSHQEHRECKAKAVMIALHLSSQEYQWTTHQSTTMKIKAKKKDRRRHVKAKDRTERSHAHLATGHRSPAVRKQGGGKTGRRSTPDTSGKVVKVGSSRLRVKSYADGGHRTQVEAMVNTC